MTASSSQGPLAGDKRLGEGQELVALGLVAREAVGDRQRPSHHLAPDLMGDASAQHPGEALLCRHQLRVRIDGDLRLAQLVHADAEGLLHLPDGAKLTDVAEEIRPLVEGVLGDVILGDELATARVEPPRLQRSRSRRQLGLGLDEHVVELAS